MARCSACGVEFEGAQQPNCPACGAPRPRLARRGPQPPESAPPGEAPVEPSPGPSGGSVARPPASSADYGWVSYRSAPAPKTAAQASGAKTPAAATPAVPQALGPLCAVCGRGPATTIEVRRHMGLILLVRFAKAKGVFCREHGEAVAREYLRRTLVEGWWGILSFFLNFWAIVVDIDALHVARRLPPPVGTTQAVSNTVPNLPADAIGAIGETYEEKANRSAILRVVMLSIGLGVVVQGLGYLTARRASDTLSRRIMIGELLILALYGAVALLIARHLGEGNLRARGRDRSTATAVATGIAVGAGAALLVIGLLALLEGRLSSDHNVLAVLSEHNKVDIVLVLMKLAVLAPLIEEVLFRGLLVESLSTRGRASAIFGGAVAFGLWHLNPAALRYYIVMGVLLGAVYWRFGLKGSISAHATFNTTLAIFAILAVSHPPHAIDRPGLHLEAPASWNEVSKGIPALVDVAAESRTGAALVVVHRDAPSAIAAAQPYQAPPGAKDARTIAVAEGTGTRFGFVGPKGETTDVVVVQRGVRRWVLTLLPQGSEQAEHDFDAMLASLRVTTI